MYMNFERGSYLTHFLCIGLLINSGCHKPSVADFGRIENKTSSDYYGDDRNKAEAALLLYRKTIEEYRNRNVKGLNYDFLMGANSARLYDLYRFTGDSHKSQQFLLESIKFFDRARNRQPGKNEDFEVSQRRVDEFLRTVDRDRVRWKRREAETGR
jgi:hypothetical protein